MVKIVFTPDWFLGKDILIEFFSFVVLLIFSILSIKGYRLKKNKSLLGLGIGFGLIALAKLSSVFTKLVLYYDSAPVQAVGQAIMTSQVFSSLDIFYYAGFFFYSFLTLMGFFVIYKIPHKKVYGGDYVLILYFIVISSILSKDLFYLFHLTAFLFLVLIVVNYLKIYQKNGFENTLMLIIAFSILALSQLIYILSKVGMFFALSNIMELISYTILLFLIIRIIKHG
ncbi:MAG: hypothetical protein KKC19_00555 [Nanoarchaeota archaeon]|nr:hypothetical protein [Nanoarchaeota archaeon]